MTALPPKPGNSHQLSEFSARCFSTPSAPSVDVDMEEAVKRSAEEMQFGKQVEKLRQQP
jgi:hypothetical protein